MDETQPASDENKINEDEGNKIDIDTLLTKEIGQFGWHQFRTTAVVIVFIVFCGVKHNLALVTARIDTRCFVSECENNTENAQFMPTWVSNAIPKLDDGSYDNCHRFARNESLSTNATEMCLPGQFDHEQLIECEKYVYENHNTVVYDFDLGCQEWRRAFIGTLGAMAYFISIPLAGYMSDRWGRRVVFTFNVFAMSLSGTAQYWCYTFDSYLILYFIVSIFVGFFSCGYILVMETVGPKYRVLLGAMASSSLSLGYVISGALAWMVPQWRNLTLIVYPPTLIIIFFWCCFPDSPRWYLSKNRFEGAEKIIKDISRMNKIDISEKVLNNLKKATEEEFRQKTLLKQEMKNEPWLPVLVFRHKPILIRCLVTPVWWFTFVLIYYSFSFNAVYLSANQYISVMAIHAIDIPGFFLSMFLLDRIGRKPVLLGSFFICAASNLTYVFISKENDAVSLTLFFIGKLCAAVVVQAVYLYTAELYPTKYRHRLFAFSSGIGRLGNLIAPLTPAFGDQIAYTLFAGFGLLSGFLTLLVPETLGCKLPDTLEEACDMKPTISKNATQST